VNISKQFRLSAFKSSHGVVWGIVKGYVRKRPSKLWRAFRVLQWFNSIIVGMSSGPWLFRIVTNSPTARLPSIFANKQYCRGCFIWFNIAGPWKCQKIQRVRVPSVAESQSGRQSWRKVTCCSQFWLFLSLVSSDLWQPICGISFLIRFISSDIWQTSWLMLADLRHLHSSKLVTLASWNWRTRTCTSCGQFCKLNGAEIDLRLSTRDGQPARFGWNGRQCSA
jgi:hypothetical protein